MKWWYKYKYMLSFFLLIVVCNASTCIADPATNSKSTNSASKTIQPIPVHENEILVHKSELCPPNSTVESQLSPTGDIMIWCSSAPKPQPVHPIRTRPNEFLLRGAELCPQSLMAIDTKIDASGDILIWCAEQPKPTIPEEKTIE